MPGKQDHVDGAGGADGEAKARDVAAAPGWSLRRMPGSSILARLANLRRPARRQEIDWQMTPLEDLLWAGERVTDWPAARRCGMTRWLNAVVPGAGLIALQRNRSGIALAATFAVSAQVAVLGLLVAPMLVPYLVTASATAIAAGTWAVAQGRLRQRMRELQDETLCLRAALRIEQARESLKVAQWAQAKRLLDEAAQYDEEQPELNWLLAKVYAATSRSDLAEAQWRRLRQVDRAGRYETDTRAALARDGEAIAA